VEPPTEELAQRPAIRRVLEETQSAELSYVVLFLVPNHSKTFGLPTNCSSKIASRQKEKGLKAIGFDQSIWSNTLIATVRLVCRSVVQRLGLL